MITRNSSVIRATEPIWMHQREPPQPPRQPLDALAIRLECGRGQMSSGRRQSPFNLFGAAAYTFTSDSRLVHRELGDGQKDAITRWLVPGRAA